MFVIGRSPAASDCSQFYIDAIDAKQIAGSYATRVVLDHEGFEPYPYLSSFSQRIYYNF
jgi:hypothetical protein